MRKTAGVITFQAHGTDIFTMLVFPIQSVSRFFPDETNSEGEAKDTTGESISTLTADNPVRTVPLRERDRGIFRRIVECVFLKKQLLACRNLIETGCLGESSASPSLV